MDDKRVSKDILIKAYEENEDFRLFVDRNMQTYGKSLDEELENVIAGEYMKWLKLS